MNKVVTKMYFNKSHWLVCLASIALLINTPTLAQQTAKEKGLSIAKETKQRNLGWGDSTSNMTMTLRNKQGQEIVRFMRNKSLEVAGDGDKSMTIFDTPLDVKGTVFLSHSHILESDDQWLYLPALKRVKRITSSNKSGPFLGSEFAYEDLSSFEVEKYTYQYLRDEQLNGLDCFVLETKPVDKNSGYSRTVIWIDKEHYRPHKVNYFDRRNTPLKTLTIEGYQQYLGKYWRADRQFMQNLKNGKSTLIEITNLTFNVGLNDSAFTQSRLQRIR